MKIEEKAEMSEKKRKQKRFLTLAEKKQVIDGSGTRESGRKLGKTFDVDRTVIGSILKNYVRWDSK